MCISDWSSDVCSSDLLFHDPQTFKADASKSAEWNRGAYLVEGLGHCGACHTPRNLLGAEKKDLALTGGTLVDAVRRDKYRTWSSVNLTSDPTGLAAWRDRKSVV